MISLCHAFDGCILLYLNQSTMTALSQALKILFHQLQKCFARLHRGWYLWYLIPCNNGYDLYFCASSIFRFNSAFSFWLCTYYKKHAWKRQGKKDRSRSDSLVYFYFSLVLTHVYKLSWRGTNYYLFGTHHQPLHLFWNELCWRVS